MNRDHDNTLLRVGEDEPMPEFKPKEATQMAYLHRRRTSAPLKSVKLDVNTSGAWKNVLLFDASDEQTNQSVMDAAAALGRIAKCKFRIAVTDAVSTPLMYWTEREGWREA